MVGSRRNPGDLLSLTEVAERLGVHYMTAYRYLRTGRLEGVKQGTEWRVRNDDLERFEAESGADAATSAATRAGTARARAGAAAPGPAPLHPRRRTDWSGRAEERLLAGDDLGAWSVLESAMAAGMDLEEVYLELLVPALRSIGDRWATGDISVADEHLAAAITMRLVGRLGPRFVRRGRKRGTIITAAPDGELHSLPVALMADLLRGRGFRVLDLGGDVPSDALASTVARTDSLIAVSLCATTPGNDSSIGEAIEAVRGAARAPVLLGGQAIVGPDAARALGADDGGSTTTAALDLFSRLPRTASRPV